MRFVEGEGAFGHGSILLCLSVHPRKRSSLSVGSTVRRICRSGAVHIDVNLLRFQTRRIAFAIAAVIRAVPRDILALWRLCELPDLGERNAALRWGWRVSRKCTSGRRWTSVVDRPINNLAPRGMLANIFGRNYFFIIGRSRARTIHSRAESGCGDAFNPRVDVSLLLGQHAAALLLIEKDDGPCRKPFAPRRGHCGLSVRLSHPRCIGFGFQFRVKPSVEENQKSESFRLYCRAMSCPRV